MAAIQRVTTVKYGEETDILIAPELAFALPCVIGNTGVDAGQDGRKVILAGTPLTADSDPLTKRETVLKKAEATSTIYGYARHDVDVTAGDANDTLLIDGYVDILKLDESVKTLIEQLSGTNNTRVRFINGRKD